MTIYCLHSLTTMLLKHVRECMRAHTNALTHHVFYWIVSHFLLSEAYPPFLPLPSCSPPILSSRLPSSTSSCHSPASLTLSLSSMFFVSSAIASSSFFLLFSLCLFVHHFFCIFLSFCGLPLATPYWAGGQCGSEAGCNYFTPPLTAIVKGE